MDRDTIICRCEEITLGDILEAIDAGAVDLNEIKRFTRAGMGLCQGNTCSRMVRNILAREKGLKAGEIKPPSYRPPVRALPLGALIPENMSKIPGKE